MSNREHADENGVIRQAGMGCKGDRWSNRAQSAPSLSSSDQRSHQERASSWRPLDRRTLRAPQRIWRV